MTAVKSFLSLIQIHQTHIKDALPFIWVFGSSKENSFRNLFLKYHWNIKHDIAKYQISRPEDYPDWFNFNNYYKNLVDFEKDVVSISQGAIIFSESVGSYAEIGIFSCFPFLYRNLLIVSEEKYINENHASFLNYGPILKIKNNDEESKNIWALDSTKDFFKEECKEISDHFLEIITSPKKDLLNIELEKDIIILLVDLMDLFPNNTISFYKDLLVNFSIDINKFNLKKFFRLLQVLEVIGSKRSGNNTLYFINDNIKYMPCVNYYMKKNGKTFDRNLFKIEMGR
ncbi:MULTISPECIES: retron St85 family effector protein [Neisseria]|jgi:putative inner membrane protein|uniref:retron St85 family effector protein n=1 Tax=Neisseria TaxID=482 RepID=UPI0008A4BA37|nr:MULTISPECIES: retron St85 family effector protein [Neisseria]OFV32996.1 hypothetical protein HMPREF3139_06040 [Neisseria sp. HMSC15G01]